VHDPAIFWICQSRFCWSKMSHLDKSHIDTDTRLLFYFLVFHSSSGSKMTR
jgi:hypothetical protein